MIPPVIQWTDEKRERLEAAVAEAVINNQDTFMFDGFEMLTKYAQYLLRYLCNTRPTYPRRLTMNGTMATR
jgi:hypothetical protein